MLHLYVSIVEKIRELLAREEGQDLAEYALLLGLIALVVFVAVILLGTNLSTIFSSMADAVGTWF